MGLWGLSNILQDSLEIRNKGLSLGIIEALESILQRCQDLNFERIEDLECESNGSIDFKTIQENFTWCLSSICLVSPAPEIFVVWNIFYMLNESFPKLETVSRFYVLKSIFDFLQDGQDEDTEHICELDSIIDYALESIDDSDLKIRSMATNIVGLMVSCDNPKPTALVLSKKSFTSKLVFSILNSPKQTKKDCLWVCTNILAGTQEQIEIFIKEKDVFNVILAELGSTDDEVAFVSLSNNAEFQRSRSEARHSRRFGTCL